jgi:hypothetical protein
MHLMCALLEESEGVVLPRIVLEGRGKFIQYKCTLFDPANMLQIACDFH